MATKKQTKTKKANYDRFLTTKESISNVRKSPKIVKKK